MQRLLHVGKMGGGRRRIVLPPVERTQKGGVRVGDHPSSPPNSAARIASTSLAEKTRSPQVLRSRAIMSGFTSRGAERVGQARGERRTCQPW